jgi:molybdate/tungstate transport system substrate-binding protein
MKKEVAFGRADPDRDPCGYRTLMTMQLAERHYGISGLTDKLLKMHGKKYMRPKETDLLALLEGGEIDYIFIYRSVAMQHGLKILLLPDEINLKLKKFRELYNTAMVKIIGKKPGEYIERKGEEMVYSVTIPRVAKNRELAERWIEFLLSERGKAIMEANGQPALRPAKADLLGNAPERLREYCEPTDWRL